MPSLKDVLPMTVKTDLVIGNAGQTINVTYKPGAIVSTWYQDNPAGATDKAQCEELAAVIESWDLTGPVPFYDVPGHKQGSLVVEGAPIPLDPAVLEFMPLPTRWAIVQAIARHARPNLPMPSGSPPAGRNGTSTSSN